MFAPQIASEALTPLNLGAYPHAIISAGVCDGIEPESCASRQASLILCLVKQQRAMMHTRPATREDIPFLLALRQQTMDAHLLASGVDTSGEYHLERVTYRFDCALILMDQGLPVGLLKVDRGPNEWEILQIQLAPEMQGTGKGRQILENVINEATEVKAGLRLGVLKANPARRLYVRLGFERVGETLHEYIMTRGV